VTGTGAYRRVIENETASKAKIDQLNEEIRELQKAVKKAKQSGGSDQVSQLLSKKQTINGVSIIAAHVDVADIDELRSLSDQVKAGLGSGAAILASGSLGAFVAISTDDLIGKGIRAEKLIKGIATITGGSGGGKPNFAQGKIGDASKLDEAFAKLDTIVAA